MAMIVLAIVVILVGAAGWLSSAPIASTVLFALSAVCGLILLILAVIRIA